MADEPNAKGFWVRLWVIVGFIVGGVSIVLELAGKFQYPEATFWLAVGIFLATVVASILS